MILNDEDAAAVKQADDYLASHIIPMGWEVVGIGHTDSVIRHRQAREAVV